MHRPRTSRTIRKTSGWVITLGAGALLGACGGRSEIGSAYERASSSGTGATGNGGAATGGAGNTGGASSGGVPNAGGLPNTGGQFPSGGGPSTGGISSCSESVYFEKQDYADPYDRQNQDCLTSDVCITRDDSQPLFNAITESSHNESCSGTQPTGTLWARGTCSEVLRDGRQFGSFISSSFAGCAPPDIVGEPGCLYLPGHVIYYDIEFHRWTEAGDGGGFAYTRTLVPCAVAGAVCVDNGGGSVSCICPAGYADNGAGRCVDVDECALGLHACHFSASCDNVPGGYACSCDTVEFRKEPYADPFASANIDCITSSVCLAREDTQSIFNAAFESSGAQCGSSSPAGTLWARRPCAEASVGDFGDFLGNSFADCSPPSIIGVPGCLWILDDNLRYDIEFSEWGSADSGGSFAYVRRLAVAPGTACN